MGEVTNQKIASKSIPSTNSLLGFSNDSESYLIDLVEAALELKEVHRESRCDKILSSELSKIASICEILDFCDCANLVENQLKQQVFEKIEKIRECIKETESTIETEEEEAEVLIQENLRLELVIENLQNSQTEESNIFHSQVQKRKNVEQKLAEIGKAASNLETLNSLSTVEARKIKEEAKLKASKDTLHLFESKLKRTEEAVGTVEDRLREVESMADISNTKNAKIVPQEFVL